MYTYNTTYASTRWVPAVREDKDALPCVRRCSWWVQAVKGRKHYFFRVKRMQLHACVHGSDASSLSVSHVQSSSDDSRLLTTLTTPCRAHQGWWMTVRPQTGTTQRCGRRGSGVT